jgi:hypothetical protein
VGRAKKQTWDSPLQQCITVTVDGVYSGFLGALHRARSASSPDPLDPDYRHAGQSRYPLWV